MAKKLSRPVEPNLGALLNRRASLLELELQIRRHPNCGLDIRDVYDVLDLHAGISSDRLDSGVLTPRQRVILNLLLGVLTFNQATAALAIVASTQVGAREKDVVLLIPPGGRLRGWLSLLCSPRTRSRILDPVLADVQFEWMEAHKAGKLSLARWVHIRGILTLLAALAMRIPLSVVRWAWEAWKKTKLG